MQITWGLPMHCTNMLYPIGSGITVQQVRQTEHKTQRNVDTLAQHCTELCASYFSPGTCSYLSATGNVCAGGYCVQDLFSKKLNIDDPNYIAHTLDMGAGVRTWSHNMYEYNTSIINDETSTTWDRIPDRRVAYESAECVIGGPLNACFAV